MEGSPPKPNPNWMGGRPPFLLPLSSFLPLLLQLGKGESYSRRCRAFGTWIGRIMKTYDYINHVAITLPLMVYEGTWTTLSPLIAMHHHDLVCA